MKPEDTILVACECSGAIRDALIERGFPAISCDIKQTERPGPHIHGDVLEILGLPWRGLIAHPVCKYLTNAGVKHLYLGGQKKNGEDPSRWEGMRKGVEFALAFERADHIPRRAWENPVMHKHAVALVGRRQDQVVQPWWFGDPFFKGTGWWLHNLPPLKKTNPLVPPKPGTDEHKKWSAVHREPPGPQRETNRSRFHPCHAAAIADQWGPLFFEDLS